MQKEEDTPDHIEFQCKKVKRMKDKKGRREWVRESGLRWDSWNALAAKEWVRMEGTGRVMRAGQSSKKWI